MDRPPATAARSAPATGTVWGTETPLETATARRPERLRRDRRHKVTAEDVEIGAAVELVVLEASDLHAAGDSATAHEILAALLAAELRCLDAHAHLGNWASARPHRAIRHYEAGLRIGELSFGDDFDGLLPWGFIDNRPFLRCLHGYALCLQQLDRTAEAIGAFERMLWLNPTDNQGARFLLADARPV